MRVEVIHPRELDEQLAAQWRARQAADPARRSPYLTPDWARLVGAARDDARVCVLNGGEGFLAVQRNSRFAAMGLGAPIADYQGVVGDTDIDVGALCRALRVGRIDLSHVPADRKAFKPAGSAGSWIVEALNGAAEYRAALKQRRGEFVRQTDKKLRKFERDHGALNFVAMSADATHFETLLRWKSAQLLRTGQPDVWSTPWVRRVVDASFASAGPHFGGALFTLSAGDQLIAASYGLRAGAVLHAWIIAHDPAFDAYSPGVLLARWAIEWAADHGVTEIDFGPGDYQFKRQLSTGQRELAWGSMSSMSWSGAVRQAECAARRLIERAPNPRLAALPGKAMRRLDLVRALAAPC